MNDELHLLSPRGFRASGVSAGIKMKQSPDVGLLVCDTLATAVAVFTTNKVFAAGVKVGRDRGERNIGDCCIERAHCQRRKDRSNHPAALFPGKAVGNG